MKTLLFRLPATMLILWVFMYSCKTGETAGGKPALQSVEILTSAQCDMCKTTIEGKLMSAKGVRSANLSMSTKKVTVKYRPEIVSVDYLRRVIASLGYDADNEKGDPEAYKRLPACCKKP